MSEPMWQPNYIDLSEGDSIRLGAQCVICGARYVTPPQVIGPMLITAALPGSSLERDLSELRFQFFKDFDAAYRDISITCYRCGRAACPDCWDEDNRMCGACVASRGLVRTPHRGLPVTGPLVDGRLERVAKGQFSDAGHPQWLSQLLDAQAALVAATAPAGADTTSSLPPGFIAPQVARRESHGPAPLPAPIGEFTGISSLIDFPIAGEGVGSFVGEPTLRQPAIDKSVQPARYISAGPVFATAAVEFGTPEGTATSSMVTCPRCGTANYDFVTRCTACQLQLIQICPRCEKLNPGHVRQCEHCGTPLNQSRGWSGIQEAIQAVPPETVREIHNGTRTTGAPPLRQTLPPAPPARHVQQAPRSSRRLRALFGDSSMHASQVALYGESGGSGWLSLLLLLVERVFTVAIVAAILLAVAGIAAAEISTRADLLIKSLIHVDVRETIAQFIQQTQLLLHQSQR